ncbi:hypothetical protein BV22DRAFT_993416, partial [Leucogyrophana mollusca]
ILKTAKKHNVSFAPNKLSTNLKKQLPAWMHLGTPPKTYNKQRNECLKINHKAITAEDLIKIAKHIQRSNNNQDQHSNRKNCKCQDCKKDRQKGCTNPHNCAQIAKEILSKINPILNPLTCPKKDKLTLTHTRIEKNRRAIISKRGDIIFDPSVMIKTSLAECFRIF